MIKVNYVIFIIFKIFFYVFLIVDSGRGHFLLWKEKLFNDCEFFAIKIMLI